MELRIHTGWLISMAFIAIGCHSKQIRSDEYALLSRDLREAHQSPERVMAAVDPVIVELGGPHPIEEYIRLALLQNPEIQAARTQVDSLAYKVPVEASLQDPMLNVTVQPAPVQTAAGEQDLILSASQKLPWFGKLATRADMAESQTNVARAQLAAAELAVIANVKRAYYELYYVQKAIVVTEEQQRLLVDIRDVANTRYQAARTSQQDVLLAEVEILDVERDLIDLNKQLVVAQARLARLLHISPQTPVRARDHLRPEETPHDLDLLQQQAVLARPELHAQLAAIEKERQAVKLARLEYKPDVTLGLSWIDVSQAGISPVANGRDAFLLSAGINLPVYRKRLDAAVRSAEAGAVTAARKYDAMKDGTLEEVTDLFVAAESQQEMLGLFEQSIIPKARQTLAVSQVAYNVGEVEFLQVIDNWQQLLSYELAYRRLEASLRQTIADLERVVGGFGGSTTTSFGSSVVRPCPSSDIIQTVIPPEIDP